MTQLEWILAGVCVCLALTLVALLMRQRAQIVREKAETFASVLGALTYGLGFSDDKERWERIGLGLSMMLGVEEPQEIRWRLLRASIIRGHRSEPALVDVVNEAGRLAIIEKVDGEGTAERVWGHFGSVIDSDRPIASLNDHEFSDSELTLAQLQLEAQLVDMYRRALRGGNK